MEIAIRSLAAVLALGLLAACSPRSAEAPVPTLADAREDVLAEISFAAPTAELKVIRSAYIAGAIALYAAHAIKTHGGSGREHQAEGILLRLDSLVARITDHQRDAAAGKFRAFKAALYALDVIELAEIAAAPVYRHYRDTVIGLVAVPQPIAIARTALDTIKNIARVDFVRAAILVDARTHAAEIAARGGALAEDWPRSLEVAVYACGKLHNLAQMQPSHMPAWCRPGASP